MVDPRPQPDEAEFCRFGKGGPLALMVKARFVLAAAVIGAALGLGISGRGVGQSGGAAGASVPDLRLDPNTAPPEVLVALPHVGSALVDRWVRAREKRPFRSAEDARARVRGLGASTLGQIAPYFEFPDGRGLSLAQVATHTTDRPPTNSRTTRPKKKAAKKTAAIQRLRLVALSSQAGDL